MINGILRGLERLPEPGRERGVSLTWHDRVDDAVRAAYEAVGGGEWVPIELLARLMETDTGQPKKIAVLHRDRAPWAVVPLRLAGRWWQPLMQAVDAELAPFPCTGHPEGVLAATGLLIRVRSSRTDPAGWRNVRARESTPSYDFDLGGSTEGYWRQRGHWKSIGKANRRTADFELVEDDLEGARWTIERWRDHFFIGDPAQISAAWADRMVALEWGLRAGTEHVWCLRDGQRWIGGLTASVHGHRLTTGTGYRDRDYDWHRPATRLFFEAFQWAHAHGLEEVSLGSVFDYKRSWAPPAGTHHEFKVGPLTAYAVLAAGRAIHLRFLRVLQRDEA